MGMKAKKLSDLKLLRYIGEITIAFCELDDAVEAAIAEELNDRLHDIGYLVTCRMTFHQKIGLYERLVSHRLFWLEKKKRIPDFEKFVKKIENIQGFRNHVMHGIRFNEKGVLFLKKNYQKKLMGYDEGISEEELPCKGWNAQYPKYEKFTLSERMLKDYLKKIEKVGEGIDAWSMSNEDNL